MAGSRRSATLSVILTDGFAENWVPDNLIKACEKCTSKFTFRNRRHHCRFCGRIFCNACTKTRLDLPDEYGYEGPQRVCFDCVPIIQGKTRGTGKRHVPGAREHQRRPRSHKDTGVDDMVMLSDISEQGILQNLEKRFNHDMIYTYIGSVLISLNPFKPITDLYSQKTLAEYRGKYPYELKPHIYALAEQMYRQMITDAEGQCVIISGESGAGKTEASKLIMQYIAAVSGRGEDVIRVKDIILDSNPLLEAFGNAKTVRNNNSSRFGKYMEIQFDGAGDPRGGRISNYLLEKSRIVYQAQSERNFHIFYQLLCGISSDLLDEYGVRGSPTPDSFHYLSQSGCYRVDRIDDMSDFNDTVNAMTTMQITMDQQKEVFRLCLAVLYLGNVNFQPTGQKDDTRCANREALGVFAHIFKVDAAMAEKSLCYRTISSGMGGRGTVYSVPSSVAEAEYSRDAFAKALYSRLFDYIIKRVNQSMHTTVSSNIVIGVLDIYGFEIFQKNGFEQFCINYVNEKLQQIFIELTLKAEQDEYEREGIPWQHIEYFNNKICCDLIESKRPIGLIALLDDVCNFPKGNDEVFLSKAADQFGPHAHFSANVNQHSFVINHYAGDVSYSVDGFVDKNKDQLFNDLVSLGQSSGSGFIRDLFPEDSSLSNKKRPTTAGFKMRDSIAELVEALSHCTPHYVRCIKPNDNKQANLYNKELVAHQARYLALLENVRVRRAGYAFRQFYEKFYFRYRVCSPRTWPTFNGDHKQAAEFILQDAHMPVEEYDLGNTKVFIRHPETVFALEEARERKLYDHAIKIQEFFDRFVGSNNYFYQLRVKGNEMVKNQKERRRKSLDRPFRADYVNFKENHHLHGIVERYGDETIAFGAGVFTYDMSLTSHRRVILVTNEAIYFLGVVPKLPPDMVKPTKAAPLNVDLVKTWYYGLHRRIALADIQDLSCSKLADDMVVIHVVNQHDMVFSCTRKTEMFAVLSEQCQLPLQFSNSIVAAMKIRKKKKVKLKNITVSFVGGGSTPPLPTQKVDDKLGWEVKVPAGEPASSVPQIEIKKVAVAKERPAMGGQPAQARHSTQQQQQQQPRATPMHSSRGSRQSMAVRGAPAPRGAPRGRARGRGAPRGRGRGRGAPPGGPTGTPAVALYDFRAENADELDLRAGDRVVVIRKRQQDDWCEVQCRGKRGLVPAPYLELH